MNKKNLKTNNMQRKSSSIINDFHFYSKIFNNPSYYGHHKSFR